MMLTAIVRRSDGLWYCSGTKQGFQEAKQAIMQCATQAGPFTTNNRVTNRNLEADRKKKACPCRAL